MSRNFVFQIATEPAKCPSMNDMIASFRGGLEESPTQTLTLNTTQISVLTQILLESQRMGFYIINEIGKHQKKCKENHDHTMMIITEQLINEGIQGILDVVEHQDPKAYSDLITARHVAEAQHG